MNFMRSFRGRFPRPYQLHSLCSAESSSVSSSLSCFSTTTTTTTVHPAISNYDVDVQIVEVGPRDGLQNESTLVSANDKVSLIRQLHDNAKLSRIEVGSFVSPKWVPQMATTEDVLKILSALSLSSNTQASPPHFSVLIPNLKGLSRALPFMRSDPSTNQESAITPSTESSNSSLIQEFNSGTSKGVIDEIAIFASASEGFSQRNLACSIDESLERFRDVVTATIDATSSSSMSIEGDTYHSSTDQPVQIRGYVSCVVACPYDGPTPPSQVARVTEALLEMGCYEVSLGDTIGVGTPGTTQRMIQEVKTSIGFEQSTTFYNETKGGFGSSLHPSSPPLAMHCHDTYGQALANILVGLEEGINTIDSSVAGLGGCPYAKGASGNVATEDVVYMLHGMGLKSGVDLDALIDAGEFICGRLNKQTESKVARAMLSKRSQ